MGPEFLPEIENVKNARFPGFFVYTPIRSFFVLS